MHILLGTLIEASTVLLKYLTHL